MPKEPPKQVTTDLVEYVIVTVPAVESLTPLAVALAELVQREQPHPRCRRPGESRGRRGHRARARRRRQPGRGSGTSNTTSAACSATVTWGWHRPLRPDSAGTPGDRGPLGRAPVGGRAAAPAAGSSPASGFRRARRVSARRPDPGRSVRSMTMRTQVLFRQNRPDLLARPPCWPRLRRPLGGIRRRPHRAAHDTRLPVRRRPAVPRGIRAAQDQNARTVSGEPSSTPPWVVLAHPTGEIVAPDGRGIRQVCAEPANTKERTMKRWMAFGLSVGLLSARRR